MSQYNIEMNQYDGNQYNQLYPITDPNNLTGPVPLEKGGTNATTGNLGLYNLMRQGTNKELASSGWLVPTYFMSKEAYCTTLKGLIYKVYCNTYIGTGTSSVTLNTFFAIEGIANLLILVKAIDSSHLYVIYMYYSSGNNSSSVSLLISSNGTSNPSLSGAQRIDNYNIRLTGISEINNNGDKYFYVILKH